MAWAAVGWDFDVGFCMDGQRVRNTGSAAVRAASAWVEALGGPIMAMRQAGDHKILWLHCGKHDT
jgi:hypothetical protein